VRAPNRVSDIRGCRSSSQQTIIWGGGFHRHQQSCQSLGSDVHTEATRALSTPASARKRKTLHLFQAGQQNASARRSSTTFLRLSRRRAATSTDVRVIHAGHANLLQRSHNSNFMIPGMGGPPLRSAARVDRRHLVGSRQIQKASQIARDSPVSGSSSRRPLRSLLRRVIAPFQALHASVCSARPKYRVT